MKNLGLIIRSAIVYICRGLSSTRSEQLVTGRNDWKIQKDIASMDELLGFNASAGCKFPVFKQSNSRFVSFLLLGELVL